MFDHYLFHPLAWFNTDPLVDKIDETVNDIEHPTIVLIHGANSSPSSFSEIRNTLNQHKYINIDYNSHQKFEHNLYAIVSSLKTRKGPFFLIGHSFGGIYAMHLSQHVATVGGITIATPHCGSRAADWVRYMLPGYQVFKEVGRKSLPIVEAKQFKLPGSWTNIISTTGHVPWHESENDGVLTYSSMDSRIDMCVVKIKSNHYEIIHHADTINAIDNSIINLAKE